MTMATEVRQRERAELRWQPQTKVSRRRTFSFLSMGKAKGHGSKSLGQGAHGNNKSSCELRACYLPSVLFSVLEAFFSFIQYNNSNKLATFMIFILQIYFTNEAIEAWSSEATFPGSKS